MGRFQHTAARRRLDSPIFCKFVVALFQHTAARRRLGICPPSSVSGCPLFQHTAARRRLGQTADDGGARRGFNTQPPEGGWRAGADAADVWLKFQHTAARRRLGRKRRRLCQSAGFNTQPPEGGWVSSLNAFAISVIVSTHSRPKAAGPSRAMCSGFCRFQHTAARRRLGLCAASGVLITEVSTHSRPKAAGLRLTSSSFKNSCFNTQPPEGGWIGHFHTAGQRAVSTHSRPKAAGPA